MCRRSPYTIVIRRTTTATTARPWTILTVWRPRTTSIWKMIRVNSHWALAVRSASDASSSPSIKHSSWSAVFGSNATYRHPNVSILPARSIWRPPRWRYGSKTIGTRRNGPRPRRGCTIRNSIRTGQCHRHDVLQCRCWCATVNPVSAENIRRARCCPEGRICCCHRIHMPIHLWFHRIINRAGAGGECRPFTISLLCQRNDDFSVAETVVRWRRTKLYTLLN